MTKECIEIIRQSLIPFVKKELLDINYEGLGKSDAEEFEKDLNEILDLAIKALEQQPSEDCVSIAELEKWLDLNFSFGGACRKLELFDRLEKELPPVTPTQRWIPISERLPEESGNYILYGKVVDYEKIAFLSGNMIVTMKSLATKKIYMTQKH